MGSLLKHGLGGVSNPVCTSDWTLLPSSAKNAPLFHRSHITGGEGFNSSSAAAVYADVADSPACVTCHNAHKDSPRDNFELGDAMGGGVIRLPLKD